MQTFAYAMFFLVNFQCDSQFAGKVLRLSMSIFLKRTSNAQEVRGSITDSIGKKYKVQLVNNKI